MKKLSIWKSIALFAVLFVGLSACSDDDNNPIVPEPNPDPDPQELNIVETASNTESLSSLVSALTQASQNDDIDLVGTLSGDGPFTVFAPTNEAFSALLESLEGYESLADFDTPEEQALLADILTYHVVNDAAVLSTDLSEGQVIPTFQGEDVIISLEGGVFVQDATEVDAQVTTADVEASNGVVHIIDKVLLPQAVLTALEDMGGEEMQTLTEIVVAEEDLSLLEEAVIKAGLAETLSGDGPFTVFAPTNEAFEGLLEALGDDYSSLEDFDEDGEIELLTNILLYHVVPDSVPASALAEGSVETAFEGNSIEVIASGDTFVIGDASETDANIATTDIIASNGIAHTINKVLLPQAAIDFLNGDDDDSDEDSTSAGATILETAKDIEGLGILVEAIDQSDNDFENSFDSEEPFTVFAPSDEAFEELLDMLGEDFEVLEDFDTDEEKNLLAAVLTYHMVVGSAVFSTDLADGQSIETEQGESLGIIIDNGTVLIDDATEENATVETADFEAGSGVIHIIDKVLIPQEVLELLAASLL